MLQFSAHSKIFRAFVSVLLVGCTGFAFAQQGLLDGLKYRLVGPFRGGRVLAVAGDPSSPEHFYFGGVGGGVWETHNAGRTWKPIFDSEPVASIGWITVAPSDPKVIYVGSGEADMRNDIQQGNGMYKSVDGGKTWTHIGLEDTRQTGKILVDPKDANTVYVAALGHQYGPNEQRGVFKSTDGGANWSKVLYKGPDVGAIDLDMDPTDPSVIYAALWATRRPPWSVYPPSNGQGSGLFKSVDAGKTWTQVQGGGFPAFVGRVGIAVSPASHNRIYAFVDTNDAKDGGIYRSDDAGATWKFTDGESRVWTRGWYFAGITADPKDPDTVYVMNTSTYRSTDAGTSFTPIKGAPGGDDYHTMWISPNDPDRMILGCDQGTVISVDHGQTWSTWYNQPTGQFYHVIADNRFPYWIYGAQQDSGAMAVPSRTIHSGISMWDWRPMNVGGESDTVSPDPLHPGVIVGSGGSTERLDTAWEQNNDPTIARSDTVWRNEWTHPIVRSPIDPRVIYIAHQEIFRSGDGGLSWTSISGDLSRKETGSLSNLDEATASDDTGLARKGLVYWIAASPVKLGTVWAGTDDGLIWLTHDDGKHWEDVTPQSVFLTADALGSNFKMGPWSKVGIIDASPYDADTAYVAVDRHRIDDNHPYIYRTHDGGKTWTLITHGIPDSEFVNVVREDPKRKGLLYAGTDWQVYYSWDDGDNWASLKLNMPAASIRDIAFAGNDVIVGTHGRAIWVLDSPTPLRDLPAENETVNFKTWVTLYRPAPTYLFQRAGSFGEGAFDEGTPLPPEEPQGENPPWGAIIDYSVHHSDSGGSSSEVTQMAVKDSHGNLVASFSSNDKPREVDFKRLDIPAYWIKPEMTLSDKDGGHRFVWNLHTKEGLLVPPGAYTLSLQIGNFPEKTVTLQVLRDPRVPASDEDLRTQYAFAQEVGAEVASVQAFMQKAAALIKSNSAKLSPDKLDQLQELLGGGGGGRRRRRIQGTPDMGGPDDQDVSSLSHISSALAGLQGAVESAPAAPSPEHRHAYSVLKKRAEDAMAAIKQITG